MTSYTNTRDNSTLAGVGFKDGDDLTTANGSRWVYQNEQWYPVTFGGSPSVQSLAVTTTSALGVEISAPGIPPILKNSSFFLSQVSLAGAATVTVNPAAGNLSGNYFYTVTFFTEIGETTSGGAVVVNPTAQQVNLTNIPVSPDSRVIGRNIYRSSAGATDALSSKLCATINDNTTTTYTDNLPDGSLGVPMPWVNTTGGMFYNGTVRVGAADPYTTSFGYGALPNNTGYANTAYGTWAMAANTTGMRNAAFGMFALTANTTGQLNTAIGIHSLGANVTGNHNTAVGFSALWNSTSSENSALGTYCLAANTTGTDNSAIGDRAGAALTTANNTTALGAYAFTNGNGAGNTAVGFSAMYSGGAGANNVAVGYQALRSAGAGSSNVAIGMQAGNSTSGSANVFVGFQSGYYQTGSNKLVIDNHARSSEADEAASSLLYGVFDLDVSKQRLYFNTIIKTLVTTVAALPSAAVVGGGFRAFVTDATSSTFAEAVVGGGSTAVPVYSDSAVWRIG